MMKLHLLGVNGPFPESRGATSGYLLEAGNSLFQFDLGSGVLGVLTSLVAPESVTALFLSHWHFDHAADIPVLMYRLQAAGKTLKVFGPPDDDAAVFRLVSSVPCFDFTTVSSGDKLSIGDAEICVTSSRHPVSAVGYTVSFEGKKFGYTGDTNTLSSLSEDFRGCDLLLADGMFTREVWTEQKHHLSAALAARAVYPKVKLAEAGAVFDL